MKGKNEAHSREEPLEEENQALYWREDQRKLVNKKAHAIDEIAANNEVIKVLKRVQVLRGLSSERVIALHRALRVVDYENGAVIIRQNDPGDLFFIIKFGKVDVVKDGIGVRTLTKHDYFGERSVIFGECRTATVIAKGNVSCWVLNQQDF